MKVTINIKGMMCSHCEARVKSALEEIPEVISAEVNHKEGTASVELSDDISFDRLKATIEAQGYSVVK